MEVEVRLFNSFGENRGLEKQFRCKCTAFKVISCSVNETFNNV